MRSRLLSVILVACLFARRLFQTITYFTVSSPTDIVRNLMHGGTKDMEHYTFFAQTHILRATDLALSVELTR